jgi:hypothetical protein
LARHLGAPRCGAFLVALGYALRFLYGTCRAHNCSLFFLVRALVHATKFLNTFEGGAVVTNNDQLAAKVRLMKNFGFCGYDNVIYIGTNGKMNEICAATD